MSPRDGQNLKTRTAPAHYRVGLKKRREGLKNKIFVKKFYVSNVEKDNSTFCTSVYLYECDKRPVLLYCFSLNY